MTSQAVRRDTRGELPVGAYEPLFELGRGGMGTVYLARALGAGGFERLTVLKRLNAHLHNQRDAVRRFLDEARVAAQVHHSNVIGTHHVGTDEGGPFLVLEYVEGGSLDDLRERAAERGERIPQPIVLRIAADALAGLHAVHMAQDASGKPLNILHRDVSLQNVLIGRDGVARIADFGIAKSTLGSVSTDKAYVVGKLLYMPREYLCREDPTPSLDVYSLGITMWLSMSGSDIWPGASDAQLIKHIVDDEVPRLSTVIQVTGEIDSLVARAVHRDPGLRYQSARSMSEDIEQLARQAGGVATHREVAEFVDSLLGPELRARRELVAKAIAESARTISGEVSSNHKISLDDKAKNSAASLGRSGPDRARHTRNDRHAWTGPALPDSADDEDEVTIARDAPLGIEVLPERVEPPIKKRNRTPLVLGAVAALAMIAAFFGLWSSKSNEGQPGPALATPISAADPTREVEAKLAPAAPIVTPESLPTASAEPRPEPSRNSPAFKRYAKQTNTPDTSGSKSGSTRRSSSGSAGHRQKPGSLPGREIGKNPYR